MSSRALRLLWNHIPAQFPEDGFSLWSSSRTHYCTRARDPAQAVSEQMLKFNGTQQALKIVFSVVVLSLSGSYQFNMLAAWFPQVSAEHVLTLEVRPFL